jgi:glyoxylase-like metal-dependent hydrolase (beta-lactamase superfamily II)
MAKMKKSDASFDGSAPTAAPEGPEKYRARVRMYRHGLGDCFLLTFPRQGDKPFHILMDCGALARDKVTMSELAGHIRDTVRGNGRGKAKLDVVVGTHEHKDHVSGFNQARKIFNDEFDFGAVWLAWTENLSKEEAQILKAAKKKALEKLRGMVAMQSEARFSTEGDVFRSVKGVLAFSQDEDDTGSGMVADAMEYLNCADGTPATFSS